MRAGLLAFVLLLAWVAGCKKSSGEEGDSGIEGRDGVTRPADAQASDAGPRYMLGAYLCCAEDEGSACCPGGTSGLTCQPYGGIYHRCIGEGETYEGKVICAKCCEGLERAGMDEPVGGDGTACGPGSAPESLLVCIRCGDGVCGPGENRCRCPRDCPH